MPILLVNPMREPAPADVPAAPRLDTLEGKTIGLLDIGKPGGSVFLDRLETLLRERYKVAKVLRMVKPTFAKPAPPQVLDELRRSAQGVIEALAD
jgi:hypothetical protein